MELLNRFVAEVRSVVEASNDDAAYEAFYAMPCLDELKAHSACFKYTELFEDGLIIPSELERGIIEALS